MSIATMNWALSQRLETHQQQILLYVIADSADPSGVTRHCDPDYMAERARLSRATTYRRLGELEDLGILSRFKFYSEHGAPIYEIRLNLAAQVDMPIRSRRKGDDDEDGGEGGTEPEAAAAEGAKSQAETLPGGPESHSSETGAVAAVRPAQSHSCDNISPPLSKSLPPNPPPGGLAPEQGFAKRSPLANGAASTVSRKEAEVSEKREALWQRFVQGYPGIAAMDQGAAQEEFDALSIEDAEWAVSVLVALKEELRKASNRPPKNAHIWLRKAMFRNFPKGRIEPPPPDEVWIAEGSDQDKALRFVRGLARVPLPFVQTRADGARGYPHKSAVGADLLAMLEFANDVPLRWPVNRRGTPEFAAWQQRFVTWVGQALPCNAGSDAIHVPCQWPPKKDGTIYRTADENLANPEETDHG